MSSEDFDFYDFGPFRLDVRAQCVRRGNQEIALTPKLFDLLAVMVRNPGRTLAKSDLLSEVWGETFVEEGSLAKSVSRLRLALAPEGAGEGLIATVARRGYRLNAEVVPGRHDASPSPVDVATTAPVAAPPDSSPARPLPFAGDAANSPRSGMRRWRLAVVAAVAIVVLGVGGWKWLAVRPASPPPVRSLAVLPFRVLRPAADTEASFAVGLADAIITRLARADNVTVRPTSAILRYEQGDVDVVAAIRTLNVDALVEGTIRESPDRVRVSAQLVGGDGRPLGAWQFDEALTELFALESAIARRVADVLALRVRAPGGAAPINAAAHEAYLRGRSLIARLTSDSLQRGIAYLTRATELDPGNAPAFSALALGHINTVDLVAKPSDAFPKARAAAERALSLDPSLGEAHAMLGTIAMQFDWDWSGAERHFRRALDLDPNNVLARVYYGWLLALTGRLPESEAQVDAARAIDPLSIDVATTGALIPYYGRRAAAAQERMRQAVELFPEFWLAHALLGRAHELSGDTAAAIGEYEAATRLEGGEPEALMDLGRAYARAGRTADARGVLRRFDDLARIRPVAPFQRAMVHIGLGDVNEAFARLDEAIEQRSWYISWLKMDPMLDPLRGDPRYGALLVRAGLEPARTPGPATVSQP